MVLETRWDGITVTDYLDASGGRPDRLAGRSDLFRCIEGQGRVLVEFAPRLDFGRHLTRLAIREGGVEVVDTADLMVLRSPGVQWELTDDGRHHTARAEIELTGEPVVLEFRYGTASTKADSRTEDERRADTLALLAGAGPTSSPLPTSQPDLVGRSALALKALCHGPTGAILAAATTSLPESVGGIRNWDYRYCWLRDAAMTAAALVRLGSFSEAMAYLDWVLGILEQRDDPERLHPLYLVTGRHLPPEADIAELAGYAGSRPVRVGNAAERQVQLDVFGPIVDLIWLAGHRGRPPVGPALAAGPGHGRRRREALAGARPRHLGGAAQPPPPRPLQGDVLGHRRPGRQGGRPTSSTATTRTGSSSGTRSATTSWPAAGRTTSGPSPRPTTAPTSTRPCSSSGSPAWSSPPTTASSPPSAPSSASCGRATPSTATAATTACPAPRAAST